MTLGHFAAGTRLTWEHHYPDGRMVERTGTVWDRAPAAEGASLVAWVIPAPRLPDDLYSVIPVGRASKQQTWPHGHEPKRAEHARAVMGGRNYSSNDPRSPLGQLAVDAKRAARH